MYQSLGSEAVRSSVFVKRGQRHATGLPSWKALGFNEASMRLQWGFNGASVGPQWGFNGAGQGGSFGEIIKAQELSNTTSLCNQSD